MKPNVVQIGRKEAEERWYSNEGVYILPVPWEPDEYSVLHKHSYMKDPSVTFDRIAWGVSGGLPIFWKPAPSKKTKKIQRIVCG